MTPATSAEPIDRRRMEKCDDTAAPMSIELLGFHAGHGGCRRFLDGLCYVAVVM